MTDPALDWTTIDTVLLDMDGTLLDLNFDNHFWLEHMPKSYAAKHGIGLEQARAELIPRYRQHEGSLKWYCIDFWSNELGMDIALLKEEVAHLIAIHPHVTGFLDALRSAGKRIVLVTNAHSKSLNLKMRKTQLGDRLDHSYCAHDFGLPKEDPCFWARLREKEPFAPQRTLFIDDSIPVLRSARAYGIGHLLAITAPDSQQADKDPAEFPYVRNFASLIASIPSAKPHSQPTPPASPC